MKTRLTLEGIEWKEFVLQDITSIQSSKEEVDEINLNQPTTGVFPYITRSNNTNGVKRFICEQPHIEKNTSNIITIGLDTQTVFYQPYSFYTGQNIQVITYNGINQYNAIFLVNILQKACSKFSWGSYGATLSRLRALRLMLPTKNNQPDWQFMESYMKQVEADILRIEAEYFKSKKTTVKPVKPLQDVQWEEFLLGDLFHFEAGKSKGLNHLKQTEEINYLGATNLNNAVLAYVEAEISLISAGNCIAFIRNGEGSMGYSVYKQEKFIATSDITLGYNQNLNRYVGTFITTIADRVRGKYNFGYKRSTARLKKEIITLPIASSKEPDWQYMENYMKNIEMKQIKDWLSCKKVSHD